MRGTATRAPAVSALDLIPPLLVGFVLGVEAWRWRTDQPETFTGTYADPAHTTMAPSADVILEEIRAVLDGYPAPEYGFPWESYLRRELPTMRTPAFDVSGRDAWIREVLSSDDERGPLRVDRPEAPGAPASAGRG